MANPTLLQIIKERFDVSVDPSSNGGQILNLLTPTEPFPPSSGELRGEAKIDSLTFGLTSAGVSVRAAQDTDAIVFRYPVGTYKFTVIPASASSALQVELELIAIDVPLTFLHAAQENSPDTLKPATGKVELALPVVLLVINASESPPASASLSPFHGASEEIPVTIKPAFASVDKDCAIGFHLKTAKVILGNSPEIFIEKLKLYIAPPGMPALAMSGDTDDLHIGLSAGTGLTGDFTLTLAGGASAPARPRFLHEMAAHLVLNHSALTLLELSGKIRLSHEIHSHFPAMDETGDEIKYIAALRLDPEWETMLTLSGSGGNNYLWRKGRTGTALANEALNTLGAFAVLAPLLKPVTMAAVGSLAGSMVFTTQSITLVGGKLQILKNPGGLREGRLFFEIEIELKMKVEGINLETTRPIKVRHRAIGIKLDFGANGAAPNLEPIIDPAEGFTLDLSDPGLFNMRDFGDLLKPDGARIARDNPLIFEVDLVSKANLGVVTIDRASVRVPILPPGFPSLTALGAHLDAGLISGGGYLKILSDGVEGRLDVALGMLGVRGSAILYLRNKADFTALAAALEVEWPIPIPLVNSGLGLFGLLGLFAMHWKRQHLEGESTLAWFRRADGEVSKFSMWGPNKGRWAFGAGAVLGTLEGGFLIHAKGMLMIELPGPRILIVMNADILKARPGLRGRKIGTILALIEVSPDSLTIAIVLDYHELKPLLEVRIPVEAFFNFHDSEDWRLDVGGIPPKKRVLVKFLESFRADGYFLIHGNGIREFEPPLYGFAIAVGVHVAFTWGPKAIGLYMTVVFEGNLGIGFKPFLLAGKASLRGELHLFILSLGISAAAEVLITDGGWQVKAEVCARVEFLFFDVEGCVTLELGDPPPLPPADPLVSALSLHARPPALLVGSGSDQPVDGSLGNAFHFDKDLNEYVGDSAEHDMPEVPIDAIPVLQLEMRPGADPACKFFTVPVHGLVASDPISRPLTIKEVPGPGWMKRGSRFYHYRLRSVELIRVGENDAPISPTLTEGNPGNNLTPVTWWDRRGAPSPGVDNEVQLALLTWQVDPTPAAAERTSSRKEILKRRWGNVCQTVVESSHILWTFRDVVAGSSANGWRLTGIARRDPADIARAGRIDLTMQVSEVWRSPDPIANSLVRVRSAHVFGNSANDGRGLIAPQTGLNPEPRQPDDPEFIDYMNLHPLPSLEGLADAVRLNAHGMTWVRILLFAHGGQYERGELLLRLLDVQGQIISDQTIEEGRNSRLIRRKEDLIDIWGDFTPWEPLVESVWTAWDNNASGFLLEGLELILVETALPDVPYQIDIGMTVDGAETWGILAIEAETAAERARVDFDNTRREVEISAVDGALHADQGKRALLIPNSKYEVKVVYEVAKAPSDDAGNPDLGQAEVEKLQTQRFQFKTQIKSPERLTPWIMATDPAPAQNFFFYQDPLRVVFATNATRKLFAAYGQKLRAVVKAASGEHPEPISFPAASESVSALSILALPGLILTPFEGVVRELLQHEECRNFQRETETHELVTLNVPLESQTDYILDFERITPSGDRVPTDDPLTPPPYRLHFTTSRYASFREMAQKVQEAAGESTRIDRWLANHTPLAKLAIPGANKERSVKDGELEDALRAVQWGDVTRPAEPRVSVIWIGNPASSPTPFAVLIETPEPIWRSRGVPLIVTEPPGDPNGIERYRLDPERWLRVPDPGALVSCFLHSTAGDRTLIVLGPNARGATLKLELQRAHHQLYEGNVSPESETLLQVHLNGAPWEEIA